MPLIRDTSRAAPKAYPPKLPSLFIGSQRLFEPKPTAANFYSPPASTGLPSPVTPTRRETASPAQPTVDAQQAFDPTFDYKTALANDPYLAEALAAINQQDAAFNATQLAAGQRAGAQFGAVPDLSNVSTDLIGNNWAGYFNDETRRLGQLGTEAGTSTVGMLNKQYQEANDAWQASLAARGMVRSSELGQRRYETDRSANQARYEAEQQLTDYLISLYQDYLGHLSQGNVARADATREALQRIIAQAAAQRAAAEAAAAAAKAKQDALDAEGWKNSPWNPDYPGTPNNIADYPNLNPTAPNQIYTPITTGSSTSFEPKPMSGNIYQPGITPEDPWISGLDLPWGADMDFHDWTEDSTPYQPYGSYTTSGGEEYWQSGRGPYGYKPMY